MNYEERLIGVMRACFLALLSGTTLFVLAGCGMLERRMNVEVIIYNYTDHSVSNFRIQGEYMGGHYQSYGPGGTGGKIYCCLDLRPGEAEVIWEIGRAPGTPEPPDGWFRKVMVEIPRPNQGDKFLGVHIYPGDAVEVSLTSNIRREKPQGVPYD